MYTNFEVLERWLRGRKRRFAKPLYGLIPVSRVRIPPSPKKFNPRMGVNFLGERSDTNCLVSRRDLKFASI